MPATITEGNATPKLAQSATPPRVTVEFRANNFPQLPVRQTIYRFWQIKGTDFLGCSNRLKLMVEVLVFVCKFDDRVGDRMLENPSFSERSTPHCSMAEFCCRRCMAYIKDSNLYHRCSKAHGRESNKII